MKHGTAAGDASILDNGFVLPIQQLQCPSEDGDIKITSQGTFLRRHKTTSRSFEKLQTPADINLSLMDVDLYLEAIKASTTFDDPAPPRQVFLTTTNNYFPCPELVMLLTSMTYCRLIKKEKTLTPICNFVDDAESRITALFNVVDSGYTFIDIPATTLPTERTHRFK